jgi:hypothetical protein
MARAKSYAGVAAEKQEAGDSYRAQVIFAARSFELRPVDKKAAVLLLGLIPQDDGQHTTWMTMGDSQCSAESLADMKSLGGLGERLPRDLARAVLLVPDKLPRDYILDKSLAWRYLCLMSMTITSVSWIYRNMQTPESRVECPVSRTPAKTGNLPLSR